jgi:hypothetical protein
MQRQSSFLFGCCGAAFAAASFFVGLEVSATTAAPSRDTATMVNRTLKGDRLPLLIRVRNVKGPFEVEAPAAVPVRRPQLLDGCEPVISSIGQPPLAQIAGRCVS